MVRVLYVDDDGDLRDMVEISLSTDPDIDTLTASDGRTALQIVQQQDIDLVIADFRMTDMDGLDLLRRLHSDHGAPHRYRVLITTAGASEADKDRMIAAGAVGLLKKPFDPLALPRIVRHLLSDPVKRDDAASADGLFGILR